MSGFVVGVKQYVGLNVSLVNLRLQSTWEVIVGSDSETAVFISELHS